MDISIWPPAQADAAGIYKSRNWIYRFGPASGVRPIYIYKSRNWIYRFGLVVARHTMLSTKVEIGYIDLAAGVRLALALIYKSRNWIYRFGQTGEVEAVLSTKVEIGYIDLAAEAMAEGTESTKVEIGYIDLAGWPEVVADQIYKSRNWIYRFG